MEQMIHSQKAATDVSTPDASPNYQDTVLPSILETIQMKQTTSKQQKIIRGIEADTGPKQTGWHNLPVTNHTL